MKRGTMRPYFQALAGRVPAHLPAAGARLLNHAPELLLGLLLLSQVARMAWAVAAAPAPDYNSLARPLANVDRSLLGRFDAFFQASGGPVTITALDLVLYGTRVDPVMGRGSAIIGAPGGTQASYFVGEEIQSGVTLQAVEADNITLSRGGASERLFLTQAEGGGAAAAPEPSAPAAGGGASMDPTELVAQTGLTPRIKDGGVNGYVLQPQGDGALFNRAGLRAGDVLVSVNGMRMTSPQSVAAMIDRLGQSADAVLEVERDGKLVTLGFEVAR